jgi:hypothetical protein
MEINLLLNIINLYFQYLFYLILILLNFNIFYFAFLIMINYLIKNYHLNLKQ